MSGPAPTPAHHHTSKEGTVRRFRSWPLLVVAAAALLLVACESEEAAEPEGDELVFEYGEEDPDDEPDDEPDEEDDDEPVEEDVDLEEVVDDYASTLPEGWLFESDVDAFAEGLEVDDAVLLDVREEDEFAEGHVPGAINIPIREIPDNLELIPTDRPVWVMCLSGWRAGQAMSALGMMGYDNLTAFPPGTQGWEADGRELVTDEEGEREDFGDPGVAPEVEEAVGEYLATMPEGYYGNSLDEVQEAVDAGAALVDVREPEEYEDGFIEEAISVPLRTIADPGEDIPTDTDVIIYCQSGYRAGLALPMAHVLGYDNAEGFPGSFAAWTEAGETVTE